MNTAQVLAAEGEKITWTLLIKGNVCTKSLTVQHYYIALCVCVCVCVCACVCVRARVCVKTHSYVSVAKNDVQHTSVLFTGTTKSPSFSTLQLLGRFLPNLYILCPLY